MKFNKKYRGDIMDIQIFPYRILSADTTENLLRDLDEVEGVQRIVLQGERLPPKESGHPDRRAITVKGQEIDLQIKTGRILIEISDESVIEDVKELSEPHLPFGFDIYAGTFIRKETGRLKYSLKTGLLLAVLGGLVFFIWGMVNSEFILLKVVYSSLTAMAAFGIIGFVLGLLIYGLEP